jgi:hypothetical protein
LTARAHRVAEAVRERLQVAPETFRDADQVVGLWTRLIERVDLLGRIEEVLTKIQNKVHVPVIDT